MKENICTTKSIASAISPSSRHALHFRILQCVTTVLLTQQVLALEMDTSKTLDRFCADAFTYDRGIVHSPFFGSMDRWLLEQIALNEEFRQKVVKAGKTLDVNIPASRKSQTRSDRSATDSDADKRIDATTTDLDRDIDKYRPDLENSLNGSVAEILPELYLRVEGLSALRRYQYREAIGIDQEQQKRIAEIVSESVDRGNAFHRSIFGTGPNKERLLEEMRQGLRQLSYELDKRVLEILNDEQLRKLAEVIQRVNKIDESLKGPGAF